ncbi:PREDICTED: putative uncharacterized protein DDB_G0280071 [Drosophila arizonae]|uniref:Uncharacterized protein n=1 Tax=Drosophila arizonae TaxID=7263 RepID=A0ABM1NMI8_DROAR|nr:PREDICTED: putative uncharacterized protein DDB_G0280071 [Drosophila arizonae]XP_017856174.1 PREDICTED: putative uncharacterized protein DDB_G0280071 [Drosophila arizonae]
MAPTVCSEKKVRLAAIKEVRRRNNMSAAQANASTSAAGAGAGAEMTPSRAELSYAIKSSTNSINRAQRRRGIALLPTGAKSVASSSSAAGLELESERTSKQAEHVERMEVDGVYNKTSTYSAHTHSSSNYNNNIKTVLQPTMANSNSNNSNSSNSSNCSGSSKTTTAKHCDHASGIGEDKEDDDEDGDGDDEEEDQGDGDSGYEFALDPIKPPNPLQQYHAHNQGLLSIAIKTIKLVQRNKLLQKRLAQLQLETSEFIASVLANPENRHFREKITAKTDAANKVSNVLLRH